MESKITIDNKEYELCYKGITILTYREAFRSDLTIDLNASQKRMFEAINQRRERLLDGLENIDDIPDKDLENLLEMSDEEAITLIVESVGPEQLEKFTWACIKSKADLDAKPFPDYKKFMRSIDDYNDFIGSCVVVYNEMIYGNKQIVNPEKDEENKEVKKKTM